MRPCLWRMPLHCGERDLACGECENVETNNTKLLVAIATTACSADVVRFVANSTRFVANTPWLVATAIGLRRVQWLVANAKSLVAAANA